jgi:hypothetical protein
MKTSFLLLILLAGVSGAANAQWRGEKSRHPSSCPLADSLLGPPRDKVSVQTNYKPTGDTTYLRSGGYSPARLRMGGALLFSGRGPTAFPAPTLNFLVGRGRLATWLVAAPVPPQLELLLDDSIHLDLGRVPVGGYNGPAEAAIAPMTVNLLPAWAIAVARARTVSLRIDSDTLDVPQQDLREFAALYRFATCDSIPAR